MRKSLGYVLGILVVLTILVYGLSWYDTPTRPSLDELERQALQGASEDDQERAALELAGRGAEAKPHLRNVLSQSNSARVQTAVIQGLGHERDWDSMPALLDALDSEDVGVRRRAGQAVTLILGADFNYQAQDSPDRRARVIKSLRAEYEKWQQTPPPMYQKDGP